MSKLKQGAALAKSAARILAALPTGAKNDALRQIAAALDESRGEILTANEKDVAAAKENGMSAAMLDRLTLTNPRIDDMGAAIEKLISLDDPVGTYLSKKTMPSGLTIGQVRVPLGVVGMIYESRPNVTVDAATLCLKSGNGAVLRSGKEAFLTSSALVAIMRRALENTSIPPDAIYLVEDTSRETATEMMSLRESIDVLIPRGGAGLIRSVVENAKVPVIETGVGVCHIYVTADANLQMAADILENAKCQRPSVCNAAECLLVDAAVAPQFLQLVLPRLQKHNVQLRADDTALAILGNAAIPATEDDWGHEFLDYTLAIRVVDGADSAMEHIARYGSGHSECIVTESYQKAQIFLQKVDAAAVYVNASTRFTDGGMFGLGAEIGISTQKMHARGPMGLEVLTSTKFVVYGNGQIRE